jgi:tRNA uridine 5-carboxymethylaminomethyl modification enzyme
LTMPHVTLKDVEDIMISLQNQDVAAVNSDDSSRMKPTPQSVYDTVEAAVKYQSYVERQHKDMESWRKAQGMRIPLDLQYEHSNFPTFSKEELEKLDRVRPSTFAEASQISGMTPQSLVYLYHYVSGRNRRRDGRSHNVVAKSS